MTSRRTTHASIPLACNSRAVVVPRSSSRHPSRTVIPSAPSCTAISRPIPLLAPVTKAIVLLRSISSAMTIHDQFHCRSSMRGRVHFGRSNGVTTDATRCAARRVRVRRGGDGTTTRATVSAASSASRQATARPRDRATARPTATATCSPRCPSPRSLGGQTGADHLRAAWRGLRCAGIFPAKVPSPGWPERSWLSGETNGPNLAAPWDPECSTPVERRP